MTFRSLTTIICTVWVPTIIIFTCQNTYAWTSNNDNDNVKEKVVTTYETIEAFTTDRANHLQLQLTTATCHKSVRKMIYRLINNNKTPSFNIHNPTAERILQVISFIYINLKTHKQLSENEFIEKYGIMSSQLPYQAFNPDEENELGQYIQQTRLWLDPVNLTAECHQMLSAVSSEY